MLVGREGEYGPGPRKGRKGGEDKKEDGAEQAPKPKPTEGGPPVVTIKGRRAQVNEARHHVERLLEEVAWSTVSVPLGAPDLIGVVLGNKGSNVKKLRQDHSGVNIEVVPEECNVYLFSDEVDSLPPAVAAIEAIINANQRSVIDMDATLGRQFFAQKGPGKALRDELTKTYPAVTIDRDRDANLLKLRGPSAEVAVVVSRIEQFRDAQLTEEVYLCKEDEVRVVGLGRGVGGVGGGRAGTRARGGAWVNGESQPQSQQHTPSRTLTHTHSVPSRPKLGPVSSTRHTCPFTGRLAPRIATWS